jgi:hypothetical protein
MRNVPDPYNNFCAVMQIVLQTWLALGLSLLGAVFSASAFKDIRERSAIASYVTADEEVVCGNSCLALRQLCYPCYMLHFRKAHILSLFPLQEVYAQQGQLQHIRTSWTDCVQGRTFMMLARVRGLSDFYISINIQRLARN